MKTLMMASGLPRLNSRHHWFSGSTMATVPRLRVQRGISAVDAYMLCSVCGDLRISEIVDMPNWVVSFYFPRSVFE